MSKAFVAFGLLLGLTGCEAANLAVTAMHGANLALDGLAATQPAAPSPYIGKCDLPDGRLIAVEREADCTGRGGTFRRLPGR